MSWGVESGQVNLGGAGVLITRPVEQAAGIDALVSASGGEPCLFPTLEITLSPRQQLDEDLARVQAGDILIFVSTNAVMGVFDNINPALYQQLKSAEIAAIGERTQAALEEEGMFVAIAPERRHQDSEGLLDHPLMRDLRGRHVYIVRAQDGRPTLGEALRARGAQLAYVQAYRRTLPADYDSAPVLAALQTGRIQFVLLTSFEAYQNLLTMLGDQATHLLLSTELIVPSERVASKIVAQHPLAVTVAGGASDEAMLSAMAGVLQ